MSDPRRLPAGTVLDACAVLSLYATHRMAEIIAVVPGPVVVADVVLQEALSIRRIVEGESEREPVDLTPLVASRVLSVVGTEDEGELQTFVDLAGDLDDGEAMTATLAIHRAYVLVTDDHKAERLLASRVQPRATLDLVEVWAETEQIGEEALRAALTGIYERGYQPPKRHALKAWWDRFIRSGEGPRGAVGG